MNAPISCHHTSCSCQFLEEGGSHPLGRAQPRTAVSQAGPNYARMHSDKCLILKRKKEKKILLLLFFNCVRWWANLKGQPQVVLVTTMHRCAATGQRPMGSLALHEISKLGAKPSGHLCSLKTRTHPLSL